MAGFNATTRIIRIELRPHVENIIVAVSNTWGEFNWQQRLPSRCAKSRPAIYMEAWLWMGHVRISYDPNSSISTTGPSTLQ